jgi:dihydroxyacetone kinase-like protein
VSVHEDGADDGVDAEAADRWLRELARVITEQKDYLTELDAAIGDADHGTNMARGLAAVIAALDAERPDTASGVLKKAATTLISKVGGASGPLYGTLFLRMATSAGAAATVDAAALGKALRAGLDGVVARGKAELGDKTMVDALAPAVDAYDKAVSDGRSLAEALDAACDAADAGRDATQPLQARKGRASYLGERSVGHLDPGATSTALLLRAARTAFAPAAS